ncbi:hypothetical protein [Xanthobacter agilis]|uniref:Uncharacterized protein n=1 Tax=Xanthobacter agilis TaxID=47492 RepID=A0ABU0LFT2_XANAG|nr:hypothetical protein [Xanthobacter agilis]MDQ0506000.1 hypothetical protein [Xanthobacter agilis]
MSEKDLAEKLADAFIAEHAGGMTMAYTPTTIDPYAEGIEAGRAGLDETENPYDCVEEKISFWAWQDGWNSIVDAEDQIGTQHD